MNKFEIACADFVERCIIDDKIHGEQPNWLWKKRISEFRKKILKKGEARDGK